MGRVSTAFRPAAGAFRYDISGRVVLMMAVFAPRIRISVRQSRAADARRVHSLIHVQPWRRYLITLSN